jgi:hypothetical protein
LWIIAGVGVLIGVVVGWFVHTAPIGQPTSARLARSPVAPVAVSDPAATGRDALSASTSLRWVYDQYARSADPSERSLAWHAWSVCVPSFVGVGGRPRAETSLGDGLPFDASRLARLVAMRTLWARCQDFFAGSPVQWLEEARANAERHRAGDLRSRGEQAVTAVEAGNGNEALALIGEIAQRHLPYELRDLSGLVGRWHRDAPRPTDALRDAVLLVVGCDFGMDCSAESELALELCAYNGACTGDLVERSLLAFPEVDRSAVNVARVALAEELRSGRFDAVRYFEPPAL